MKVTSFKDVETYLYSSVIAPLKKLNTNLSGVESPLRSTNGEKVWTLQVVPEPPIRSYRRQYQRMQARRKANLQVVLYTGTREYVVAMYNPKHHWVKVYERPFRVLKATPLMGKLYEAFQNNTPFSKVISELDPPIARGEVADTTGDTEVNYDSWDIEEDE